MHGWIKSKAAGRLTHRQTSNGQNCKHHVQISQSPRRSTPWILVRPVLFSIFINDLPHRAFSKSFGYVDDFKIVGSNPVNLRIQRKRIWKWCKENLLSINQTKKKAFPIKGLPDLLVNDFIFGTSTAVKDVGLIVSSDLPWSAHTKQRASKSLNVLLYLKRSLSATTESSRKDAYISYVVRILKCGSSFWIPNKSDLSVLESIQRKAVMWILNTKDSSYKDMLLKLGLLPLSLYP